MASGMFRGYREEATRLRAQADGLFHGRAKRALLRLARDFDALATASEGPSRASDSSVTEGAGASALLLMSRVGLVPSRSRPRVPARRVAAEDLQIPLPLEGETS